MWTPNDFYISRDFFNRELINFQVGFVLRADSLWLDPLNKNTLLVTFSVSQQRYTRTTGTITLYISCVFAEEDGSWRKAAQSAAVPDSIRPNLFHQASQPYQNQSLCAGVCDFYVPLWKMSGLLMTGSRASRNDFPRHVFHPFCRSNFIRTESSGCRSYRSGMGRTPCLSSKYWRYTRYTHIHNSAMPIIVLRENWLWRTSTRHRKNPNQSGVVAVDSCAFIQLFSQYRRLIALMVWLFTLLIMQNHGCLPFAWAKPVGSLFRTGKFRPGIAFTIVYKSVPFIEKRPRKPENGINDGFSCSSAWTILSGKTGKPFQIFRCSCFR